jgi:hypothetical protein
VSDSLIYVCDLDGTLLRSDGTLSNFAREGLNRLLDGVQLTVASSRATPAMRVLLAGVELHLPVIEFNGAFVLLAVAGREEVASVVGFVHDTEAEALTHHLSDLGGDGAVVHSARNFYVPGWSELQVQHPLAEKGAALETLLDACHSGGRIQRRGRCSTPLAGRSPELIPQPTFAPPRCGQGRMRHRLRNPAVLGGNAFS